MKITLKSRFSFTLIVSLFFIVGCGHKKENTWINHYKLLYLLNRADKNNYEEYYLKPIKDKCFSSPNADTVRLKVIGDIFAGLHEEFRSFSDSLLSATGGYTSEGDMVGLDNVADCQKFLFHENRIENFKRRVNAHLNELEYRGITKQQRKWYLNGNLDAIHGNTQTSVGEIIRPKPIFPADENTMPTFGDRYFNDVPKIAAIVFLERLEITYIIYETLVYSEQLE